MSDASRTPWSGWRGPTIALAAAGFLISAALCGWYGFQRSRIDTSYTADSEIAAGNELLAEYDPEQLSDIWRAFAKMSLRTKTPPPFHQWNLYASILERRALTSGAIAALFALVFLGVWFTTPRASQRTTSS